MVEIVPAIIAKNEKELEGKIKLVRDEANFIQLDIMDNLFVPNITFSNPLQISKIINKYPEISFEAHLMIKNPQKEIGAWLESGCDRLIIHFESANKEDIASALDSVRKQKIEAGLAINPETKITHIKDLIPKLDLLLFLSVHPGFYGRKFLKSAIKKIELFHKSHPDVKIEVDGGLNEKNMDEVIKAGANNLVFGSLIYNNPNPQQVIINLKKHANKK